MSASLYGSFNIPLRKVLPVQTSCGWGVPLMSDSKEEPPTGLLTDRSTMNSFASKMEAKGKLREYQAGFNQRSLDGLPGLRVARRDKDEWLWLSDLEASVRRIKAQMGVLILGLVIGMMLMAVMNSFIPGGMI